MVIIVVLAAGLRLYRLGVQSLWYDEIVGFSRSDVAQYTLTEVIFRVNFPGDFLNPPIYYLTMNLMSRFSTSEFALRLPSAIAGILAVFFVYLAAKASFGPPVGILAALLMAISPFAIYFSQESRPHGILLLFGLAATYFLTRAIQTRSPRHWAAYVFCAALAFYSGFLVLTAMIFLVQNLYLFFHWRTDKRLLGPWLASQGAMALLFAPWMLSHLTIYWQILTSPSHPFYAYTEVWPGPSPLLVAAILKDFLQGDYFNLAFLLPQLPQAAQGLLALRYVPVFIYLPIVLVGLVVRRQNRLALVLWTAYLALPLGIMYLLSLKAPFLTARHASFLVPAVPILLAMGIHTLPWRGLRKVLIVGLVVVSVVSLANYYQNPQYEKEQWREVAQYIAGVGQKGDVILLNPNYLEVAFDHYYRGSEPRHGLDRWIGEDEERAAMTLEEVVVGHTRAWLILAHRPSSGQKLKEILEERHPLVEEKRFVGIEVYLYRISSG
ncbi:MAG: glycosyltransferase family 39 protein [Chloroflexi bacterium]|nr:glycosyltransferase family 39 protein [Chloroflexota bacterium]